MQPATIHVVRSNHAEVLVQALSERLRAPLNDPFAKELIVVQGRGMAVWLNMELARHCGVWAHAEYLYPKHFVARAFEWVFGDSEHADDRFTREQLVWAVAAALPQHLGHPAFERLRAYIGGEVGSARLFQLAARIAESFDEYLTFRPDLVVLWERPDHAFDEPQLSLFGESEASDPAVWQRRLWRSVVELLGSTHPAARARRFFQTLQRKGKRSGLPQRISVFGLSSLPPLYTRVLAALSGQVEVNLFQLSPCREYIGDIIGRAKEANPLGHEENRLLKSYGAVGAEFREVLDRQCQELSVAELEDAEYRVNSETTTLGRLQNDILTFSEREASTFDPESLDESIRIHACHSPIREVEVLHDQLLDLFAQRKAEPHEVVVMTPDIDVYSPLIQAVFERPSGDPGRIPFRISDRNLKGDSPVLDALYRVLSLVEERLTAPQVLDLLSLSPVHSKFEIAASELEIIAKWVLDSGIRWGEDADHKAQFGVPHSEQNTWRFGLDRLLLGYATRSDDFQLVDDTATCDGVEGKLGVLLGRFARFLHNLFEQRRRLKRPQPITEWRGAVTDVLATLIHCDGESQWQHQQVLSAVVEMERCATHCNYQDLIELAVFKKLLERHFDVNRGARGFLAGGVTFCALVPMRSIPFRVVYLLGMNDTAFPRNSQRPDFNLLEAAPESRQLGDPNRRADDRYLFLEALLSARSQFILSYVGQSIRDNSRRAPSVVVTELVDYLTQKYATERKDDARVRQRLTTWHPLQPFSPRYYNGVEPGLFSYEASYLDGARRISEARMTAPNLFSALLSKPAPVSEIPLSEVMRFFRGPASYLLRQRLGVYLETRPLEIPEREPLELNQLESYDVGQLILERRLAGAAPAETFDLIQKSGRIPFGTPGRFEFTKAEDSAEPIYQAFTDLTSGRPPTSLELSVALASSQTLIGSARSLFPKGLVLHQFSRSGSRPLLMAWIQHLTLCAARRALDAVGVAPVTWLLARRSEGRGAAVTRFETVDDPLPFLLDLIQLFEAGQRWPVPFFAEGSLAFVRSLAKHDRAHAWDSANRDWQKDVSYSETLQRVYGSALRLESIPIPEVAKGEDDSGWRFDVVAQRVYEPMLKHLEKVS